MPKYYEITVKSIVIQFAENNVNCNAKEKSYCSRTETGVHIRAELSPVRDRFLEGDFRETAAACISFFLFFSHPSRFTANFRSRRGRGHERQPTGIQDKTRLQSAVIELTLLRRAGPLQNDRRLSTRLRIVRAPGVFWDVSFARAAAFSHAARCARVMTLGFIDCQELAAVLRCKARTSGGIMNSN